jgi:hypothetical protein
VLHEFFLFGEYNGKSKESTAYHERTDRPNSVEEFNAFFRAERAVQNDITEAPYTHADEQQCGDPVEW